MNSHIKSGSRRCTGRLICATALLSPAFWLGLGCQTSSSWHLEEHVLALEQGTEIAVMSDCRGNDTLVWQIHDNEGSGFPEPSKVAVKCGVQVERPGDDFRGWGWTKTNWPSRIGCTYETRLTHGEQECDDYFRAIRDSAQVNAPWCQLSFIYEQPVNIDATLTTYCVTRNGL